MGISGPLRDKAVSHGICNKCMKKVEKSMSKGGNKMNDNSIPNFWSDSIVTEDVI